MKKIVSILFLVSIVFICFDAAAQVPNRQRKKPAKKVAPKPLPPPPAPVEIPKEPTLEETKTWVLEKVMKYKPMVYFASSIPAKNNCSYLVTAASFDQNDHLVLHLSSEQTSACYKDQLQTITIDFRLIDVKKTNTVESTRRILLFPITLEKPFSLTYAPESAMKKQSIIQYNTIIAFDKSATYETNLATRMGKAFIKMNEFKKTTTDVKDIY
jgi:hypothetical protein